MVILSLDQFLKKKKISKGLKKELLKPTKIYAKEILKISQKT